MANAKPLKLESGKLKEMIASDLVPTNNLGTGTANASSFLRGDQTWVTPSGGGSASFFFYSTASDIATYYEMDQTLPSGGIQYIDNTGVIDGQLLAVFSTILGRPGINFIPAGIFNIFIHGYVTAGTKTVQIRADIYKRSAGGTETLLASSANSVLFTGVDSEKSVDAAIGTPINLLLTDRLVVKIYAVIGVSGSDPDVRLSVEDDTNSRLDIPASIVIIDQNLNFNNTFLLMGG